MIGVTTCIDFHKKYIVSLYHKFLKTMIVAISEVLKPTLRMMSSQKNDSEWLSSDVI